MTKVDLTSSTVSIGIIFGDSEGFKNSSILALMLMQNWHSGLDSLLRRNFGSGQGIWSMPSVDMF